MIKRVVMIGPDLRVRGGVSSVERLLVGDQIDGASVTLLATTTDTGKIIKLFQGIFSWIRFLPKLIFRPDLVHIHFASRGSTWRKLPFAVLSSLFRIPVVLHSHGAEFKKFYQNESGPIRKAIIRLFLNRASSLVVLSESWKEFYSGICSLSSERIVVMRNPVDFDALSQNFEENKSEKILITSNGRIGVRKGSYDTIDALSQLPQDVSEKVRFVATGDGEHEKLERYVDLKNLGTLARIEHWLPNNEFQLIRNSASIFLLPSYDEGLPMAMIEAMAIGQVPIVTPVGGIPEVIEHDRNGLIVEPGDITAISDAICRLVRDEDLLERLSNQAKLTAKRLDVQGYRKELFSIYLKSINSNSSHHSN